ncbi:MAG: DUF2251 domain-containing protein [Pyrinomonadaceae bacterium]
MPNFVVDAPSGGTLSAVFEDDGETGYLYVYEEGGRGILAHLQIYDCAAELNIFEDDVRVIWSVEQDKCGVIILDGMRGIINVPDGDMCRVKMASRDSVPLTDPEWLRGF